MYNIFEDTLSLSSDVCTLCLSQNKDSREIFTFLVEIVLFPKTYEQYNVNGFWSGSFKPGNFKRKRRIKTGEYL